jgi:hypothetical protein
LKKLREQTPPVIARIVENKVRLNPRTLLNESEVTRLAAILAGI